MKQPIESKKIEFEEGYLTVSYEAKEAPAQTIDRQTPLKIGPGYLTLEQIELIFEHLPLEISFVDENNCFQYFNRTSNFEDMMAKRTPSQIGRSMELSHPPQLWPMINTLMEELESGQRQTDHTWSWDKEGRLIYKQFVPLFDPEGHYRGTIETVEDGATIHHLKEKEKLTIDPLNSNQ